VSVGNKTPDEYFPRHEFWNIGYKYQNYRVENSYNGLAILSKKLMTKISEANK